MYCKEFGLTSEQYDQEPVDKVLIKLEIMGIIGEINAAKQRMAERGQ